MRKNNIYYFSYSLDPEVKPVKNKKEKPGTVSTGKEKTTDNQTIKDISLAWNFLRKNSISPTEQTIYELLEGFKKDIRPYVLNPKFSAPTSLPLYFFFGYQLFQESESLERCGPVRLKNFLLSFFFFQIMIIMNIRVNFFFKLLFTFQLARVWSVLIKQRIVSFFLDSPFGGTKSQSMRLRESFVRSRSKLWYELFTRVICTGKNHRYAISFNFYLLWDFHKRTECKRIENIFQTVSCEGCEFKKHDCLHMQWILKVYTKQF